MKMIFNALDAATDEGGVTGRVLTLENIAEIVLWAHNFFCYTFQDSALVNRLHFCYHNL